MFFPKPHGGNRWMPFTGPIVMATKQYSIAFAGDPGSPKKRPHKKRERGGERGADAQLADGCLGVDHCVLTPITSHHAMLKMIRRMVRCETCQEGVGNRRFWNARRPAEAA